MERPLLPTSKTLNQICALIGANFLGTDQSISGITHDSSQVQKGDLFFGFAGKNAHGAQFWKSAQNAGACAIVTDAQGASLVLDFPTIIVKDPRLSAGIVSAWFYGEPMRDIFTVGVTGTNGKTTITTLLYQIWAHVGRESGLIGTVETRIGTDVVRSQRTTPESPELQALVATMRERHVRNLAMEVSSHALSLQRMRGSHFNIVALSNVSQDHLDFHGTMEEYYLSKAGLFAYEYADLAVINIDDQYGARLAQETQLPVLRISRHNPKADWSYVSAVPTKAGFDVSIRGSGGILIDGCLSLHGNYNLDNALMAIAVACESGVDNLDIASALPYLTGAQGRLERVDLGQNFLAFVDYAHSPDSVKNVLQACREISQGRVIAVLGCGGDRDISKRPVMGQALLAGADIAIFTSDNPRSESASDILVQMVSSSTITAPSAVIEDRKMAIAYALSHAQSGDVVIILGKGHESGQEIAGVIYPFDDRLELASAIEARS